MKRSRHSPSELDWCSRIKLPSIAMSVAPNGVDFNTCFVVREDGYFKSKAFVCAISAYEYIKRCFKWLMLHKEAHLTAKEKRILVLRALIRSSYHDGRFGIYKISTAKATVYPVDLMQFIIIDLPWFNVTREELNDEIEYVKELE